jgi:hypothetical protein
MATAPCIRADDDSGHRLAKRFERADEIWGPRDMDAICPKQRSITVRRLHERRYAVLLRERYEGWKSRAIEI